MTKAQRNSLRKKRVLEHAERIGNVRQTCRYFGASRSVFYLWTMRLRSGTKEDCVSKRPQRFTIHESGVTTP
jgi:hypothetical protein